MWAGVVRTSQFPHLRFQVVVLVAVNRRWDTAKVTLALFVCAYVCVCVRERAFVQVNSAKKILIDDSALPM